MVRVKVYAEGGGDSQLQDTLFRQGWAGFFKSAGLSGRMPRVVRGKGRERTFDLFVTALRNRRDDELPLLLLDSEDPVASSHTAWQHLKDRDGWDRPTGASNDQAFLMVQAMETWLISDRNLLREFFGADLRENQLPAWPDLEAVPKDDVLRALDTATAACGRNRYAKGRTSFRLLERLDPQTVKSKCPHAKALLDRLETV